ncbi:glutathione S-transferase family protein [Vibrio sp. DW001]|uniref:glutathione S-transferase family protein n=1 Tax=Vibrio sp. DW001 TaxID=2912315 RepID=UPI0023B04FDE|nr:glutathione S-transferase family protein [Vibrio sp. DW001]WED27580.1 glutathione S-transferase family protein [Vibrio sp. DW001]
MENSLHIFGPQFSTFVRTVMLCCEEKGIEYSVGLSSAGISIELKSEAHFALHPFGKFPVLIHGKNRVFETPSICRYLDTEFEGTELQPKDTTKKILVDQWSTAIAIYVDKILIRDYLLEFAFPKGKDGTIRREVIAEVEPRVIQALKDLEPLLTECDFICGEHYSMADALLTPMLDYLYTMPIKDHLFQSVPKLKNYIIRMQQRPSGIKVLTH